MVECEESGWLSISCGSGKGRHHWVFGIGSSTRQVTNVATRPVVEVEFMGYANSSQIGTGLRQRLYSRAFIIGEPDEPENRFVYIITDLQSGDTAARYGVLEALAALGDEYSMYGQSNLALVGTHSHNGPAGQMNYLLPQITSLGFDKQNYQAIVDGIVLSIQRAHQSLTPSTLSYGTVPLEDASINRSPYAYLANPAEERANYTADVDQFMSVLKFQRVSDGLDTGILTWFPVHGTSMYGNNTLVTGDNKGVAADMFEKSVKGTTTVADNFVAGFSQSNVGDTTPNILGAWCEDGTNVQCTFDFSLCSGVTENCHGRGPNFTVKDEGATSCYEIGRRQFAAAYSLYNNWDSTSTNLTGSVIRSFHTFQNMTGFEFQLPNGTQVQTCAAALGYSFAGGTSDWPGSFDFKQGDNQTSNGTSANPLWAVVADLIRAPSPQQRACQGMKPILLDVGEMPFPYAWAPDIADIQVLRVGQLFMIISPGEATTMSGRRWKNAIASAATTQESGLSLPENTPPIVVLGGPANSYTHYLATEEEYNIQRYEGASTLYGPNTLNAYIYLTTSYLPYLSSTNPPVDPLPTGPLPPNNVNVSLSFISPVVYDTAPLFKSFGSILTDVPLIASQGDTVTAVFVGANPRNDLRLESSYATVEQLTNNTNNAMQIWTTVRDDSSWDLIFHWTRTNEALGESQVIIEWQTSSVEPAGVLVEKGVYRLRYFGAWKAAITGTVTAFEGVSGEVEFS